MKPAGHATAQLPANAPSTVLPIAPPVPCQSLQLDHTLQTTPALQRMTTDTILADVLQMQPDELNDLGPDKDIKVRRSPPEPAYMLKLRVHAKRQLGCADVNMAL